MMPRVSVYGAIPGEEQVGCWFECFVGRAWLSWQFWELPWLEEKEVERILFSAVIMESAFGGLEE